jgi:negative regulator of flagellin synthesis FlgM
MKVSNSGPKNPGVAGTATPNTTAATTKSARGGQSAAAEALGATVGSSTKVDVSSRAQEMKRAKEMATPNSGVDDAKVARLQAMIDSGTYKVDADALAERLVSEQLKMNE